MAEDEGFLMHFSPAPSVVPLYGIKHPKLLTNGTWGFTEMLKPSWQRCIRNPSSSQSKWTAEPMLAAWRRISSALTHNDTVFGTSAPSVELRYLHMSRACSRPHLQVCVGVKARKP